MRNLEVRELEYFVAVAEDLHFARAARRLHIVQPALSRAIQRLESRLRVRLLVRSSRHVALTSAGEALLDHAREVLDAVDRAASSTRAAAEGRTGLRLVVKPSGDDDLIPNIVNAWARRPRAPYVHIVFGSTDDRVDHLLDGRADLAILNSPLDDLTGLKSCELFTEGSVAVLPAQHRLSGRTTVTMADLAGETMIRWAGLANDADGLEVSSTSELALLVALGRAITVLPRSTVGHLSEIAVCVPVSDAPPNSTVIAWDPKNESPELEAFAQTALFVSATHGCNDVFEKARVAHP